MENVIITEHASFRYCQRIRCEALINLASYKSSVKFDADKYKTVESEILDKLSKSIFVVCGAFDKDNIKSNFYLNKEERIIFVLDSSQAKLITLLLILIFSLFLLLIIKFFLSFITHAVTNRMCLRFYFLTHSFNCIIV